MLTLSNLVIGRTAAIGDVVATIGGVTAPPPTADTGDVAISSAATRDPSTGTITFSAHRTGDTSGPKSWPWRIGPSTLGNGAGATAADFGGTYPTGTLTWPAGSTVTRTITVTPQGGALPE